MEHHHRESLLDRFPFHASEVDHLLGIFDACHHSLFDHDEATTLPCLKSLVAYLPKNHRDDDHRHHHYHYPSPETRASVEALVPALPRIFQNECQTAFVVGIYDPNLLRKAKFMEACTVLLGRGGNHKRKTLSTRIIYEANVEPSPRALAQFVVRLARAASLLQCQQHDNDSHPQQQQQHDNRLEQVVADSLLSPANGNRSNNNRDHDHQTVSLQRWTEWVDQEGAESGSLLSTIFQYLLLGPPHQGQLRSSWLFEWVTATAAAAGGVNDHEPSASTATTLDTPLAESAFWQSPWDPIPFQLALMGLGGPWCRDAQRLYTSDLDGFSFATFLEALVAFVGPTLILIETSSSSSNAVLAYYTELPWKAGPQWRTAETESSFLCRLGPCWTQYGRQQQHNNQNDDTYPTAATSLRQRPTFHQYLHHHHQQQRHKTTGALTGLAVGGVAADAPRLWLTTSLEHCQAGSIDTTFAPGPLLGDENELFFDVQVLEVWAIQSPDEFAKAQAAGKLQAAVRESTRVHAAQVDKRHFVEDLASGAYMNSVYTHRNHTQGRTDYMKSEDE